MHHEPHGRRRKQPTAHLRAHLRRINPPPPPDLCLVLATFIPPTGLIPPEDAPDYAKKSMSYREGFGEAPTKGATLEQRVTQLEKRTKKKSKSAKKNK